MYVLVLRRYETVLKVMHLRSTSFLGGDCTPRLVLSMARITLSSIPYFRLFIDCWGWHPLGTAQGEGQIIQADRNDLTAKDPQTNTSCLFMHLGDLGEEEEEGLRLEKYWVIVKKNASPRPLVRWPLDGGDQARNTNMHQFIWSKWPWDPCSSLQETAVAWLRLAAWRGEGSFPQQTSQAKPYGQTWKIIHRI